jgi:hypothetical protein
VIDTDAFNGRSSARAKEITLDMITEADKIRLAELQARYSQLIVINLGSGSIDRSRARDISDTEADMTRLPEPRTQHSQLIIINCSGAIDRSSARDKELDKISSVDNTRLVEGPAKYSQPIVRGPRGGPSGSTAKATALEMDAKHGKSIITYVNWLNGGRDILS